MTPADKLKQLDAEFAALLARPCPPLPKPKPKPKVVTDKGNTIAEAIVKVSKADPNFARSRDGEVRVLTDSVDRVDENGIPVYSASRRVVSEYNPFSDDRMNYGADEPLAPAPTPQKVPPFKDGSYIVSGKRIFPK